MTIGADKIADMRMKHLDLVQGIITRMAAQGATLKNYCITLVTAVCGFAVTLQRPGVALLAILPVLAFWMLDAQYLRVERRFRVLFDRVREQNAQSVPTFSIALRDAPEQSFWSAASSWSTASFYSPLMIGIMAVSCILMVIHGK